jgi:hypothetical protein
MLSVFVVFGVPAYQPTKKKGNIVIASFALLHIFYLLSLS